ncbi:hypothetical protein K438DRAFT_1770913 [Mycena galopus ATCC 62051]|nr:hypothetical protein K438DRAFT_1770913 [Mycena galopus ATCC 62051]
MQSNTRNRFTKCGILPAQGNLSEGCQVNHTRQIWIRVGSWRANKKERSEHLDGQFQVAWSALEQQSSCSKTTHLMIVATPEATIFKGAGRAVRRVRRACSTGFRRRVTDPFRRGLEIFADGTVTGRFGGLTARRMCRVQVIKQGFFVPKIRGNVHFQISPAFNLEVELVLS